MRASVADQLVRSRKPACRVVVGANLTCRKLRYVVVVSKVAPG